MSHPHGTALLERKLIEEERKLSKLLEEICEKHDVSIIESLSSNSVKTRRRAASSDMQPVGTLSASETRSLSPLFRRNSDLTETKEAVNEPLKAANSNKELQSLLEQNALDVSDMLRSKDSTIDGLKKQINELENTIIRFIQYKNSVASSAQLLTTSVSKALNSPTSPVTQPKCTIALKDKEFVLKMNTLLAKQVQQSVPVPESVTKRLNQIQKDYSSSFGANKTAFIDVYSVPRSSQPAVYPVQPLQIMSMTTESTLTQLFDQLVLRQSYLNNMSSNNNNSSSSSSSSSSKDTSGKKPVWIDKRLFVMFCLIAGMCEEAKLNLSMILRFYDENTTPVLLKATAEYEQLLNYHGFVNAMNHVGSVKAAKGKVPPSSSVTNISSGEMRTLTSSMSASALVSASPVAPRPAPPTPGSSGNSSGAASASSSASVSVSTPSRPPPPAPPSTPPISKITTINSSSSSSSSNSSSGSAGGVVPPPVRPPPSTPPPPAKTPSAPASALPPPSTAATATAAKTSSNVIAVSVSSGLSVLVESSLSFILGDMIENSAAIDAFLDLFLPVAREEVIGVFAKHQPVFHAAYGRSKSYGLMDSKRVSSGSAGPAKKKATMSPTKSKVAAASLQDTSTYSNFEIFCCNFDIVPHLCGVSVARRISQYVSYVTVTEDFSYLIACIYYLAVYLTDSADWGIPLTHAAGASRKNARAVVMGEEEEGEGEENDKAKLNSTQRQQVHFQAVLDNIEKIIWSIEASSH